MGDKPQPFVSAPRWYEALTTICYPGRVLIESLETESVETAFPSEKVVQI